MTTLRTLVSRVAMPDSKEYVGLVLESVRQRLRWVAGIGGLMYMTFWGLDWAVYPQLAREFLIVRVVVSALILLAFLATFSSRMARYVLWIADVAMIIAGAGISGMIYMADGASSNYYQGLNIVLLAIAACNSYSLVHSLFAGGGVILSYLVAIALYPGSLNVAGFFSALFFVTSIHIFVLVMTKLYQTQHFGQFAKAEQIKALERVRSEFFANVSHELRTPLTLILAPMKRVLASEHLSDSVRSYLQIVERNATVLLRHVEDLLDLARLDASRMTLEAESLDMVRLVEFVLSHFEEAARQRNIRLELVSEDSELTADVDRNKIQRILFNLISNAMKFTPQGGRISCRLRSEGDDIELSVSDTGPGVPPTMRAAIFDRFQQADSGDERRYEGVGLGLAIVKEFVELHGGTVTVEESDLEEGTGARFTVRMPRRRQIARPVAKEALEPQIGVEAYIDVERPVGESLLPISGQTAAPPEGQGQILLVEDNPEMRRFLAEVLSEEGSVRAVASAKEALHVIAQRKPDLIVTDVMMPVMSGEQLLRQIRSDRAYDDVPVMVLTAKADPETRERLLLAGAQDYLAKPFSVVELKARARNLLAMSRIRGVLQSELEKQSLDVVEMTLELAESRNAAHEARALAEQASRSKDEFLLNLSHELRTPLAAIIGWMDLIQSGDLPQTEIDKALEAIDRNAKVQLRLISDLLDMARTVQGKLEMSFEQTDFRQIVDAAVASVATALKKKNIALRVDTPSAPLTVVCDQDRMQQVIWNLLSNAAKFTPENGHVEISCTHDEENVTLTVRDDGIGMDPEMREHVFDRFMQGDSSITKRFGGLGLGLGIAKQLVEIHGGQIEAHSEGKDKGSTFTVRLPFRPPRYAEELRQEAKLATP